jgi:hypothetical protein
MMPGASVASVAWKTASPAMAIGMHWEIKDQSKHQRVSSRNRQQYCYPSQLGHVRVDIKHGYAGP